MKRVSIVGFPLLLPISNGWQIETGVPGTDFPQDVLDRWRQMLDRRAVHNRNRHPAVCEVEMLSEWRIIRPERGPTLPRSGLLDDRDISLGITVGRPRFSRAPLEPVLPPSPGRAERHGFERKYSGSEERVAGRGYGVASAARWRDGDCQTYLAVKVFKIRG
jgi:hypothetical protein